MARMLVRLVCAALLILGTTAIVAAQVQKQLVIVPVASVDGQTLYRAYCAGCHGEDGHGRGMNAPGLAVPPPDLTTVCARHGDKSVVTHLSSEIRGYDRAVASDGQVVVMPAFGPLFDHIYAEPADRNVRVVALVSYVKKIQTP
jgi:mono/diheme cytochrome c family protein